MKTVLFLVFFLLPGLAQAETFPALYDVSGVAGNDVLNVRSMPNPSADIGATLAPEARDIEVVRLSDDMQWGLVNVGDRAGWVSMRYMERHPGQEWGVLPQSLHCGGTEPFWGFDTSADGKAQFTELDLARDFDIRDRFPSRGFPGDFAVIAEGLDGRATAIVAQRSCNDGMSDREYGMSVALLHEGADGAALFMGCCSLK